MRSWRDAPRALLRGLDVLLLGLTLLAVLLAPARWPAAAAGVALVGVYLWGRVRVRVHERPIDARGLRWWPERMWMAALLVLWVLLLLASPAGLWVAFPLMLLQMHVLGPRWGVGAVALTVVAAVAVGILRRPDGDAWLGYLVGPVLGGLVAIGFVLGLEAIVRESQARQRTLTELEAAQALLADAERERVLAQERERLAREIHDTLAQGFSAVELLLRAARNDLGHDDDHVRDLLDQAGEAARDNLAEARRFVRALAPRDLARSTLPDALARVTSRASTASLAVHLHTSGVVRELPVAVETALLRVAQSALANVTQHAGASRADVTLTYTADAVLLDVVDDGAGFDPEAAPTSGGGYGLRAMRSRAQELGGTLTIETAPGAGTAVAMSVPGGEEGVAP